MPECYEWIKRIGKEDKLDQIQWMQLMAPIGDLATQELKEGYEPFYNVKSLNEFPITDEDTPFLISIYNFFKELDSSSHRDEIERLERAIVFGSYPEIPDSVKERLVTFAFDNHISSGQRLKASISNQIAPYLRLGGL
jgi:hypothetical protein